MIRNHLNILVHLAKIDGVFEDSELKLVYNLGYKHGLSDPEIKDIIDNPQPFRVESLSLNDRFEQFGDVVEMMMIDKKLHERELKFCAKLAKKLNLQDVMIYILIKLLTGGKFTKKDKEEIRKELFG